LRISLFGVGYIGSVAAACLARDGHEVQVLDVNPDKIAALRAGRSTIVEAGVEPLIKAGVDAGRIAVTEDVEAAVRFSALSLVCVGTPSTKGGALDLRAVERVVADIGAALRSKTGFHAVAVRSTLTPGAMAARIAPALEGASGLKAGVGFGLAYHPEFLREGQALEDYDRPSLAVMAATDPETLRRLKAVQPRRTPEPQVMDFGEAEAVKIAANAWRAVRISFANDMGAVLSALDIDPERVMEAVAGDPRLAGSAYMKPGFAFGGSCLPKDVRALSAVAQAVGRSAPALQAALEANETNLDHAVSLVEAAGRRRVSVIGLAFKEGVDDVRESPALALAARLAAKGYDLRLFDPGVRPDRLTGANLAHLLEQLPEAEALLCSALDTALRHGETLVLVHPKLGAEALALAEPGRRIVDLVRVRPGLRSGGDYVGLCW
jgi:GDP-mannose 6-dehydrogenase